MRAVVRFLLRRWCPIAGVADRHVADRINADSQRCQRDRGEEKDLAPDCKQRRSEPDSGFQLPTRDYRVSLKHSLHRPH